MIIKLTILIDPRGIYY